MPEAVSYTHLDVYKRQPAVGIEVPNHKKTPVYIRSIFESQSFLRMTSPLGIALGKDIAGVAPVSYTHLRQTVPGSRLRKQRGPEKQRKKRWKKQRACCRRQPADLQHRQRR